MAEMVIIQLYGTEKKKIKYRGHYYYKLSTTLYILYQNIYYCIYKTYCNRILTRSHSIPKHLVTATNLKNYLKTKQNKNKNKAEHDMYAPNFDRH